MSAYEVSPKAARIIHSALLCYARMFDEIGDELPQLMQELIETFAPPQPPTAAELAEALRTALADDYPQARADAFAVLDRYSAWQP